MRRYTCIAILVPMLAVLVAAPARAQGDQGDEELGEAKGLEPSAPAGPQQPAETSAPASAWRWRGYGLVDWKRIRLPEPLDETRTIGPSYEAGAAADAALAHGVSLFAEGRVRYEDDDALDVEARERPLGVLDQGGVRWRPTDRLSLALGKERNRRAPGLVISPSDFLHSRQSLPGEREERSGIWLARASWQTEAQTVDLIGLPVDAMRKNGFPAEDAEPLGGAARYFGRFSGVDLGVDAGRLDGSWKAGGFAQTIAWQVWKLYGEAGYDEKSDAGSQLLGVGYEGGKTWSLRAEWLSTESAPLTFAPGRYALVSVSGHELLDRINLSDTFMRSVDEWRWLNLARAELLVSDRHTVGVTLTHLGDTAWQALADWRISL